MLAHARRCNDIVFENLDRKPLDVFIGRKGILYFQSDPLESRLVSGQRSFAVTGKVASQRDGLIALLQSIIGFSRRTRGQSEQKRRHNKSVGRSHKLVRTVVREALSNAPLEKPNHFNYLWPSMDVNERRAQARRALALSDEALWAECESEFFVAGGPGGQHRNKTESGVRLSHPFTEMSVTATERRSQYENRHVALERLRQGLKALTFVPKPRRKTQPTRGSKERRLSSKKQRSQTKAQRRQRDD